MKRTLLVAVAVYGVLGYAGSTRAADVAMSPKGQAFAESLRTVPGASTDMIDRSVKSSSPKGIAQAESQRSVSSVGRNIDLAHGARPSLSPKDPRYDQELRRLQESQVAPLK